MQQDREPRAGVETGAAAGDRVDQQRVLRDGKNMRAGGLPVPAGDAREPVRDVRDLDVERGGEQAQERLLQYRTIPARRGNPRR